MHFFIKTLQNCHNNLFKNTVQKMSASMKVCLQIMEKLWTLNHLLEDVLLKNTLFQKDFWRNESYWRTIFQEAAPGILAIYKIEHFPTRLDSLQTLDTVAKISMFTYGRASGTTSGYKSKWRQRLLNHELTPEAVTGGFL